MSHLTRNERAKWLHSGLLLNVFGLSKRESYRTELFQKRVTRAAHDLIHMVLPASNKSKTLFFNPPLPFYPEHFSVGRQSRPCVFGL
jgi:hypothetical protein